MSKDKTKENLTQLLLGVMTVIYTIQRSTAAYDAVVDNIMNAQKALLIGMADQALPPQNNAVREYTLEDATRETLEEYVSIKPNFLTSIEKTFYNELETLQNNFHFHTEKIKGVTKIAPTLEDSILLFPNLLLAPDALTQLNEITEKLVRSTASVSSKNNNAEKILIAVKAGGFTAMGYSMINMYRLGKQIARITGIEIKDRMSASSLASSLMIHNSYKTLVKLPTHLARITTASMLAFASGTLSGIINEDANLGLKTDKLEELTKSTFSDYVKLASDTALSAINDWLKAYQFQKDKLKKLDEKLTLEEGIVKVMTEKPWKNPSELLMRKTMEEATTIKPILNATKAGITATKATIFSTAFKLGKFTGRTISWLVSGKTQEKTETAAHVTPITTPSKLHTTTHLSKG